MGASESVAVANAFPQDVWVRVRSERISESSWEQDAASELQVPNIGKLSISGSAKKKKKTLHETLINEGFSNLPAQKVSTYKPPSSVNKTVFITALYYDAEGNERNIATDLPHRESHTVIITKTGGIIDSDKSKGHWTDLSGENHKEDPCDVCLSIKSVCMACLVGDRVNQIRKSIEVVQSCTLSKSLVEVAELATHATSADQEIIQMTKNIKDLAKEYWALEEDTKRAVRKVKIYGENLKEAAEDYLNDNIIEDFRKEVVNMQEAKDKLEVVNNKHAIINGEVSKIGHEAQEMSKHHQNVAIKAKKYIDGQGDVLSYISMPVVGQVSTALVGGFCAGQAAAQSVDNVPLKIAVGAIAGVGGAAGGFLCSTAMIPAAPYFWYQSIKSRMDREKSAVLKEKYESIALKMSLISEHLGSISSSLHAIEDHLSNSQAVEEKAISAQSPDKKSKWVKKVTDKAGDLINACEYYYTVVNDTKIIEIKAIRPV